MAFTTQYSILFSVRILNFFHLNKGLQEFSLMSGTDQDKQLDSYNFGNFFTIVPTKETMKKMNGRNLIFKTLNSGLCIFTKVIESENNIPFIPLEQDLNFTFLIKLADPCFYNYTDLKPNSSDKIYFFSNKRLSTESVSFPLIKSETDSYSIDESYLLTTDSSKIELAELSTSEKIGLFGIVRIFMRGDESSLHVIDSLNQIPTPNQIFELQFTNRKTYWRYIFRSEQTVTDTSDVEIEGDNPKILITKEEQPLTERGFISINLKGTNLPNPSAGQVIPDSTGNNYYSEIYM
jgi:hypothetical protein